MGMAMSRRRALAVHAMTAVACLAFCGCGEELRVSMGTRMPPELRGASSVQVTERFNRVVRGEDLSMIATLIDFSYLRAITRERNRPIDREREAYERYLRRRTSFYVQLVLHDVDVCRSPGRRSARRRGPEQERLDLQAWTFTLRTSEGRERDAQEVEPGATQLAPTGGCIVQGYVCFDGNLPQRTDWIVLDASFGRGDDEMQAELRWEIDSWTPPPRRPRRPDRSSPRPEADEDDSS